MQQYGRKYFAHTPPPPPTLGVGVKILKKSEDGLVAYQLKGNHEYRNTVASILPADPQPSPLDPGVR